MKEKDEIKQMNEIINKIDIIKDEDWQQKEGETEQEYNRRIEEVENDMEEELLDYISDSLLSEQDIDEKEAIKEAEEKINKDYELFSDAFEKTTEGKIQLKSKEELEKLGYDSQEEYEKLLEIENNFNNPEQYFDQIRDSIKKNKDLDSEIDRKMELAKAIILAKKRGEEYSPETYQKANIGKFTKLNDYIVDTTVLSRVPMIQEEFIRNNAIEENKYVSFVNNLNTGIATPNVTTGINTMQPIQPIVLQMIPAKKNEVYTYLENKLDKDKDQTKQKILARTELKVFLKNYENKDLDEQESNDLKQKIAEIEQKYPNSITNKVLEKLFDSFKIKLAEEKENSEGKSQGTQGSENEEDSDKKSQHIQTNIVAGSKSVPMPISAEQEKDKKIIENIIPKITVTGIPNAIDINKLFIKDIDNMVIYLKKYNDPEIQAEFNKIINTMDELTGNDFADNIDKMDLPFDILLLEKMHEWHRKGAKSIDGKRVILEKNIKKSLNYLSKEGEYLLHLKNKAETKVDNPIENLKNEAKFTQVLKRTSENLYRLTIAKAMDEIALMTRVESIKRNNNESDRQILVKKIESYIKKFNNNEKIGNYGLEILGEIFYNGIQATNGDCILRPNKRKAKIFYEKLLTDNIDYKKPIIYNRLLELYKEANNKQKADEIKQKMVEKSISEEQSAPADKMKTKEPCTYVCSDLHGEYDAYKAIIEKLGKDDKLYILGDVIDRGDDGIKILQDIMERQKKGQVEFLMGNHEFMMIQTLLNIENYRNAWFGNGGEATYKEFKKLTPEKQEEMKEFLINSAIYKQINTGNQDYYLIHAKAIQDTDETTQTFKQMIDKGQETKALEALQSSVPYDCKEEDIPKKDMFTIIGHTPTFNTIQLSKGYIDIDCGIAYGRQLALVNLTEGEVQYFNAESIKEKAKTKEENQQDR